MSTINAEVWINGQMPRRAGITSPATIQGFNIPNRVVLADSVKAGDKFQVAIFGINGPISVAPANFLFFRQASIEFSSYPRRPTRFRLSLRGRSFFAAACGTGSPWMSSCLMRRAPTRRISR